MKIKLLTIGEKMPRWLEDGVADFTKRLPSDLGFELHRLPMAKRTKNKGAVQYKAEEAKTLLAASAKSTRRIALDVQGKSISTDALVSKLEQWQLEGETVALYIGGPDGLDQSVLSDCHEKWSLSAMTMPHPIAQLVLVEQIYRAWSITQGHPYHRA